MQKNIQAEVAICPMCNGAGTDGPSDMPCYMCKGTGEVIEASLKEPE